jgi:hypothetical protein
MTAHFPSWHAVVTYLLERLSSAPCDLVRSSSRKILLGSQSVVDLNRRKRVESNPIKALSRVTSWRSKWSLRNEVLITMGFEDGRSRGSPLTLRFSSCACLVLSSRSLACTTSSIATRGGEGTLSLPLTTCAHDLMCVSVSCLKVVC